MKQNIHPILGIDIGGANLKVFTGDVVDLHYCPLWRESPIQEILRPYIPAQKVAVVMSGELADSFSSKMEGISFIVSEVLSVFPHAQFYGIDGAFHKKPCIELAAANWLAACDAFCEEFPSAVLVDFGSTTTDIIPLKNAHELTGYTDLKRLQDGYLLYLGLLRTPIATLISEVILDGVSTAISTEFFSNAADAHLIMDTITPDLYTCERADGGDTSYESCVRRMSRVVCADPDEIGENGARQIAKTFIERQKEIIVSGVERICAQTQASEVICAGIGAKMLSLWLTERGFVCHIPEYADALPAYGVSLLAKHGEDAPAR
ncbi:MAG: H4MPT-linked C1 transfer pathway protein [Methanomicrobiales archaeon]|jgi:probable H4MPT-linked C1 transfer pathway protein|nr:H4MPT-linked C1 transfer pathway protein [Methanomicrobiales archaeon]